MRTATFFEWQRIEREDEPRRVSLRCVLTVDGLGPRGVPDFPSDTPPRLR